MKALYIAWQDPKSRRWAPVGQLTRDGETYRFVYTRGAEVIQNFKPFGRMTDMHTAYFSDELFPLFANRVLPKGRPEYKEYLYWLGLNEADHDALDELARTGGLRATDSLELFPCPEPTCENNYEVRFFSRGLRHLNLENQARARDLKPGERLFLMRDLQNEHDAMALLLRTGDPIFLVGYAPRYYSEEFNQLIGLSNQENAKVTVEQVNQDAPIQYRVLCRFASLWPVNFHPCAGENFRTLV